MKKGEAMESQVLRQLVWEALKLEELTQFGHITLSVSKLAADRNLFPSREECREKGVNYSYYEQKQLNPLDELAVHQIVWDLIIDRVLTIGCDESNMEWPFLRLTEFGHSATEDKGSSYYDPEGYVGNLLIINSNIDQAVIQYITEGLNCFRQRLFFAAAVMLGAAAEKVLLLLIESIAKAEIDSKKQKLLKSLVERPNLPKIFSAIQNTVNSLIKKKKISYSVHRGTSEHLLSLFEMIRVQRNDAIHPIGGQVEKKKVYLSIQSFPTVLEVTYGLIKWFKTNKI